MTVKQFLKDTGAFAGSNTETLKPAGQNSRNLVGDKNIVSRRINIDEQALLAIFDHSFDAIIVSDDDLICVAANPAACALLGVSADQMIGKSLTVFSDVALEQIEALRRDLEAQHVSERDWMIARPDGSKRVAEVRLLAGAAPGRHVLIMRDVTESKQAQQKLKQLEGAVAAASTSIVIMDAAPPDFAAIYVNPAFTEITGYSADEVIGRNLRFLYRDDSDQPALETLRAALRKGESCQVVLRNYGKDGSLFYNELYVAPVHDDHGHVQQFIAIQTDVSERVQLQIALEQSEKYYRMVSELSSGFAFAFRNTPDHLLVLEWVTDSFTEMLGYTVDEAQQRGYLSVIYAEDLGAIQASMVPLLKNSGEDAFECRVLTKSNDTLYLVGHLRSVSDDETGRVTRLYGVARDVTVHRELEQEKLQTVVLQSELGKERALAAQRDQFTSMLLHEFRNPLSVLNMSTDMLSHYIDRMSPERRAERLTVIRSQITRMTNLVEDMLLVARSKLGELPFKPSAFDLKDRCQKIVAEMEMIEQAGHVFAVQISDDVGFVTLDQRLLRHILTNLIGNAVKYSPPNSTILLRVDQDTDAITLVIQDQGIGIPLEEQTQLFEPFFRASNAADIIGTGLGLVVVMNSVQAHGGTINVYSSEGEGTRFTIRLPVSLSMPVSENQ